MTCSRLTANRQPSLERAEKTTSLAHGHSEAHKTFCFMERRWLVKSWPAKDPACTASTSTLQFHSRSRCGQASNMATRTIAPTTSILSPIGINPSHTWRSLRCRMSTSGYRRCSLWVAPEILKDRMIRIVCILAERLRISVNAVLSDSFLSVSLGRLWKPPIDCCHRVEIHPACWEDS